MRLPRSPLLIAFSLLASAATAPAECAWVLWVVYGDGSGGIKLVRETLKGCIEGLSRDAEAHIRTFTFAGFKPPQFLQSDETHKVMVFLSEQQSKPQMVRLQCLPDTIPQPPRP